MDFVISDSLFFLHRLSPFFLAYFPLLPLPVCSPYRRHSQDMSSLQCHRICILHVQHANHCCVPFPLFSFNMLHNCCLRLKNSLALPSRHWVLIYFLFVCLLCFGATLLSVKDATSPNCLRSKAILLIKETRVFVNHLTQGCDEVRNEVAPLFCENVMKNIDIYHTRGIS